jgi:hypothetical protein
MEDMDMSNAETSTTSPSAGQFPKPMTVDDHLDVAEWLVEWLADGVNDLVEAVNNLGDVSEDVQEAADELIWEAEHARSQISSRFEALRLIVNKDDCE